MLSVATIAPNTGLAAPFGVPDAVLLGIALLFGVVLRLPLHVIQIMRFANGMPAGDMSGVLSKISRLQGRRWIGYECPDSVTDGFFAYPVLFHWLVSRFPRRHWRSASVALNILPDLLIAAAIYAGLRMRLDGAPEARELAFLACLVTVSMPMLVNTRGRMKATNGRSLGMLLGTGYLLAIGLFAHDGHWAWAGAAVALGLLAILASQFAIQAIMFFSPLLAVLLLDWRPLAVLATVLAVALTVRPLGAWHVLMFKLNHLKWYRRNKHRAPGSTQFRGLFTGMASLPKHLLRQPGRARRTLLDDAALVILLYTLTPIWLLGWALADPDAFAAALGDPVLRYCLACVACAGAVFFLTSLRAFSELGQSERYFQYPLPMLVFAAVALGVEQGRFGTTALIATLAVQMILLVLMHVNASLPVWKYVRQFPSLAAEQEVAEWLLARDEPPRVAVMPQQLQRLWSTLTRGRAGADVRYLSLWVLDPNDLTGGFRWLDEIYTTNFQVPGVEPEWLRERYGIDHAIVLRAYAEQASITGLPYIEALRERCPVVFENDKYAVHRIDAATSEVTAEATAT